MLYVIALLRLGRRGGDRLAQLLDRGPLVGGE